MPVAIENLNECWTRPSNKNKPTEGVCASVCVSVFLLVFVLRAGRVQQSFKF